MGTQARQLSPHKRTAPPISRETVRSLENGGDRARFAVYAGGRVLLRSRRGTDRTASFSELRTAALMRLPDDTGLEGSCDLWGCLSHKASQAAQLP
jgi:hypothetical protein